MEPIFVLVAGDGVDRSRLGDAVAEESSVEATILTVDPRDALAALERSPPDVVVVGVADGADLAASIRETDPRVGVVEASTVAGESGSGEVPSSADYRALASRIVESVPTAGFEDPRSGVWEDLVSNPFDVVSILDPDGTTRYVGPSIAEIAGYDPEDLEGRDTVELVHPDDRESVREEFFGDPAEWEGEQRKVTYRFQDADGGYRVVESVARNKVGDPRIEGVVVNSRDVTDRERRREELELYETIVETVPVGIQVIGPEYGGPLEWFNDRFSRPFDKTEEELLDSRVIDLIEEGYFEHEMGEKYIEGVRNMLSSDSDADRLIEDVVFHDPSGRDRYFNVHWGLRPLEDGEFQGTVTVFQEITRRKEYERELERKNERLEQFASFVSHDLRNPLNVAQGWITQVEESDDPAVVETAIDEIGVSLDRMEQLIDELLTMAREGHDVDEFEPVELDDVATAAWSTVDTSGATLEVADTTPVMADRGLLRQVLENLFRNATEHGGSDVAVTVGLLRDGGTLSGLYVEDDGTGLPDVSDRELFDLGYTTAEDGTGFGLGIVDQIVRAHGWEVTATDGESGGARFEVTGVEDGRDAGDGS